MLIGTNDIDINISVRRYENLCRFIYEQCGIVLGQEKLTLVQGRLRKRASALGFPSINAYIDYILTNNLNSGEYFNLIDSLTTNKTDFFRESNHFDFLVRIFPDVLRNHPNQIIKVWSAGCSTGEEPYTIAIVLEELREKYNFDYEITATDISVKVLKIAKTAIYEAEKVEAIPKIVKRKYLLASKNKDSMLYRIVPKLRNKVKFLRINFLENISFEETFDFIFCRNVIIYFDKATQQSVVRKIGRNLAPKGYLFLGHSESVDVAVTGLRRLQSTVYQPDKCNE